MPSHSGTTIKKKPSQLNESIAQNANRTFSNSNSHTVTFVVLCQLDQTKNIKNPIFLKYSKIRKDILLRTMIVMEDSSEHKWTNNRKTKWRKFGCELRWLVYIYVKKDSGRDRERCRLWTSKIKNRNK